MRAITLNMNDKHFIDFEQEILTFLKRWEEKQNETQIS